ncbi:MAG: hypothetical protein LiPW31_187 [Microgenomates group bacterium LiPW_31]|nr:MAG: hypothetical protein LiPW31_187 [Microgenomates group bacterium LiPW_31]
MRRLKEAVEGTLGFLRERATGTPRDVHEILVAEDERRKRLGIDPWDAVRKEAVQREKEQLGARLEGSKPAKP